MGRRSEEIFSYPPQPGDLEPFDPKAYVDSLFEVAA